MKGNWNHEGPRVLLVDKDCLRSGSNPHPQKETQTSAVFRLLGAVGAAGFCRAFPFVELRCSECVPGSPCLSSVSN